MKSIIYIDRNNLYFYGGNVHAPLTLPFQPTTVRDIEVINAEELEKQILNFIKQNKIEPSEGGIVVAHQSTFEKIIPAKTPSEQIPEIKKHFLDNVPFQEILTKELTNEKGIRIIATNKDLIYLIRDIFNKNHFKIETIVPIAVLYPDGDITFNTASAQQILNKASTLKQQSFLLKDAEIVSTDRFEEGTVKEKKNKTLYYLIPVFVIAIGILVWLILSQRSAASKPRTTISPVPTRTSARQSATPTIVPTVVVTSSPSATLLSKDTITFQVLNGSGIPGQADTVRDALIEKEYTSITTGNAPALRSSRTLIVYKSRIPEAQVKEIVDIVSPIVGEVSTQVNEEISYDVLITTASTDSNSTGSSTTTP